MLLPLPALPCTVSAPRMAPEEAGRLYRAPAALAREAHVSSLAQYEKLYRRSVEEPHEFWGDIAKEFYWKSHHSGPFLQYNFDVTKGKIFVEWMKGSTTNICYNLLDRNVNEKKLGDKIAFYWFMFFPENPSTVLTRRQDGHICPGDWEEHILVREHCCIVFEVKAFNMRDFPYLRTYMLARLNRCPSKCCCLKQSLN